MSPKKMIRLLFAAAAAKGYEVFEKLGAGGGGGARPPQKKKKKFF